MCRKAREHRRHNGHIAARVNELSTMFSFALKLCNLENRDWKIARSFLDLDRQGATRWSFPRNLDSFSTVAQSYSSGISENIVLSDVPDL
jgi:hypothetical protein